MSVIAVIGSGAWGTALAHVYAASGHDVILWSRNKVLTEHLTARSENNTYLPGVKLSPSLSYTSDLPTAMKAKFLLLATPAQHIRTILAQMKPHLRPDHILILTCKGIDLDTDMLLTDVVKSIVPELPCAILTGPTFARDLGFGLPGAATIAGNDDKVVEEICQGLVSRLLRLYKTDDVIGAQVGGAVKNVIAIACGIVEGLKLGESARAALVTRGLAEIGRLSIALGGRRETLLGLCGVGDLMLTCNSMLSRNFSLGFAMGQGRNAHDVLAERKSVTEGVPTAKAVAHLAAKMNIDMPIVAAVNACLHENVSVQEAVSQILERPTRSERE